MDPSETVPEAPSMDARRASALAFVRPLALVVVTLAATAFLPADHGLLTLAFVSWAFAVDTTLRRGGDYLTPSGVFFLASGIFIGGGAYYLSIVDTAVAVETLRDATTLALLSTIAVDAMLTAFSVRRHLVWPARTDDSRARGWRPPRQFALKGLLMLAMSQVPLVQALIGPFASGMGVGGVIVLVLWASSRQFHMRWFGDGLLIGLTVALPYAWIKLTYTGGGRLMIAGIMIAAFVGWNLMAPRRIQKVFVICCIPLFLAFAGLNRLGQNDGAEDEGQSASSVVASGDGLGSVYSPLETWGRVIGPPPPDESVAIGPRYGATFLNTLFLPIPRQVWEDKPKGFGAELTEVLEPELVSVEHSMAALLQSEWYANFGYAGLVLMVPGTAWFLLLLDRRHARLATDGLSDARSWWQAAVLICVVSSMADLVWVGTFTMVSRGGLAAIVVAVIGTMSLTRKGARISELPAQVRRSDRERPVHTGVR